MAPWVVENQVFEYGEYWNWECFSKAVSLLVFGDDPRIFHVVCNDMFVKEA